ncbi:phenylalanine--tRNA ligase subunit beta [Candidatus Parcubacteria bacterium]|nr:MAG: phenylalanine--tRNA ligase subunit beta [Candidatus Parcubacteria bacterium]
MNIKILDSWLREYLKTKVKAEELGKYLSLTSVSIEKIEKVTQGQSKAPPGTVAKQRLGLLPGGLKMTGQTEDYVYDIEVTTNRPDLMSIIGIAREAATVLSQEGKKAEYTEAKYKNNFKPQEKTLEINIKNDPKLVNRICAIIMEVKIGESPEFIKQRLEASGIRSLNNLIDVTNYIMREIGHPTHVFDYDRLDTKTLIIRESKPGEKIITLDGKIHTLKGGDIVADNGQGEIVDLLGVMGTENSVVTEKTKRILFFIDNNDPQKIRKTSMNLGIRSEAAVLNEKGVDPSLTISALLRGIELYQKIADAEIVSNIIDIYPNKPEVKEIKISQEKINEVIGINIPLKISTQILKRLGFHVISKRNNLNITVPSWRNNDIEIPEDIIEEIARIYGYYKLPNILPPLLKKGPYHLEDDPLYWERKVKNTLIYWGFTEVYTYSFVSENLLEGPPEEALKLSNPLNEDMLYMRKTIVPSLLEVIKNNEERNEIKIFELANVYQPRPNDLPQEILTLAAVIKKPNLNFYEIKGIVEQLLNGLGIKNANYKNRQKGGLGADIYIKNDYIGEIEILDDNLSNFELNFEITRKYTTLKKTYKPIPKFPPTIEDVRLTIDPKISYQQIVSTIKTQSNLVVEVSLLDVYEDKKTFRIKYQNPYKTLTTEEVTKVRENIYKALIKEFKVKIT